MNENEACTKATEEKETKDAREWFVALRSKYDNDPVSITEVINHIRRFTAEMITEQSDSIVSETDRLAKRREVILSLKY